MSKSQLIHKNIQIDYSSMKLSPIKSKSTSTANSTKQNSKFIL